MIRLDQNQVEEILKKQTGWKLVDEVWIEKKYRFKKYLEGIEFVNQVANRAEEANHHPFISIDYKLITLKMSSWKAKGITELDFELAIDYDEIYKNLKCE